jgi:hypothetical protein
MIARGEVPGRLEVVDAIPHDRGKQRFIISAVPSPSGTGQESAAGVTARRVVGYRCRCLGIPKHRSPRPTRRAEAGSGTV